MLKWLTFKSRITKIVLVVTHNYTRQTKPTVLDLFNEFSNHAPLNYSGQESKNNLQFMIDITVILKYLPYTTSAKKNNVKVCVKSENTIIPLEYV